MFGFLNRKKKDKRELYELKSKGSCLLKHLKETSTFAFAYKVVRLLLEESILILRRNINRQLSSYTNISNSVSEFSKTLQEVSKRISEIRKSIQGISEKKGYINLEKRYRKPSKQNTGLEKFSTRFTKRFERCFRIFFRNSS